MTAKYEYQTLPRLDGGTREGFEAAGTATVAKLEAWARAYGECLLYPDPVLRARLIHVVSRSSDRGQTWIARLDGWTSVVLVSMAVDAEGSLESIATAAVVED